MGIVYEDLSDIEKRPGAGVGLWTKAVELQLNRVREVNYRHRLHNSPNEDEKREDPDAEREPHADVYFLALAVRRLLLFHEAFTKQVADPRLREARAAFEKRAPNAKVFRDFYEHLDEYLLDSARKHVPNPGRAAPLLLSRWEQRPTDDGIPRIVELTFGRSTIIGNEDDPPEISTGVLLEAGDRRGPRGHGR